MRRPILISAGPTGVSRVVFALVNARLADMLERGHFLAPDFASGPLGSLFAGVVTIRGREN